MFSRVFLFCGLWGVLQANPTVSDKDLFQLSIIHINDFHARFEEVTPDGSPCRGTGCVGGFSRMYSAVHSLLKSQPNAIFLNAGDNFQGTIWYNVHRWDVTQFFFNMIPTDAYTLGNHEFDNDIDGVVPFIKALKAPVLVANIDDSREPKFQGIYQKSTVVERSGRRIGIIGAMSTLTPELASPGNLIFLDALSSINAEAEQLVTQQNCSIIVVLSHCGIDVDLAMAGNLHKNIGLVVGGHSHSMLYPGPAPSGDQRRGPYPIRVHRSYWPPVLVVQAASFSKYVGNLSVWYDNDGGVIRWEGKPIYLDSTMPQDPEINRMLGTWKRSIDVFGNRTIGSSNVNFIKSECYKQECNLGNLLTDAMVHYYSTMPDDLWTYAGVAILNSGAIRSSLVRGDITYGDLVSVSPFESRIAVGELTGAEIKEFLEYTVNDTYSDPAVKRFLQVSGMQVTYDMKKPIGSRVTSLRIMCRLCGATKVPSIEPYSPDGMYRVAMSSFLADGGDGFSMIRDKIRNPKLGPQLIEVFEFYITKASPLVTGLQERIHVQH